MRAIGAEGGLNYRPRGANSRPFGPDAGSAGGVAEPDGARCIALYSLTLTVLHSKNSSNEIYSVACRRHLNETAKLRKNSDGISPTWKNWTKSFRTVSRMYDLRAGG